MNRIDTSRRDLLKAGGLGVLGCVTPSLALAQEWPAKQLRIVVPYAAGGTADAYARSIGLHFQKMLKQAVVVDNKPGGNGLIGLNELARSAPDGYTLALCPTSVYWGNRAFYKRMPFDPDKDVQPFSFLPVGPAIFATYLNARFRNVLEFIAYAKEHPTSVGTYAQGSYAHIMIDQLNRSHGTKIEPVHYKGEAPMWVDAAAGTIDAAFGNYASFAALYDAKRLRPLGVTTLARSPKFPDLPTFWESGLRDEIFGKESFTSMVAPASTPAQILKKLSELTVEWADTPEGTRFRQQYGIGTKPTLYAETVTRAKAEAPLWIEMTRNLGIPPQ
ncbi:tripartite tricarboxylate transporter substrate binding protein [Acidovorax sp. JHL-9]|uniref:Bug family tripartite tricarboxylate transporter substrate binding protein n=1 Tax=Acidovorax sp. JHL-9 TaxID=1276756 RepID=UPI000400BB8D|nr:tripartite tricarboxylate transporter substrate binding protein [Acidovorax sp. JHL-9]